MESPIAYLPALPPAMPGLNTTATTTCPSLPPHQGSSLIQASGKVEGSAGRTGLVYITPVISGLCGDAALEIRQLLSHPKQ